ncbi:hypothetical protein PB70LOC_00858 [Pectobacterium versatile]|nr:Hypothetical protein SCC1_2773 [Pectobacterium versatile]POY60369.1 hypothetical protein PB70LOC_00858 [Pectobacterium versatile]POY64160.1 hypothetical protein PB69LOC_00419 [Pectobacterium versatile]
MARTEGVMRHKICDVSLFCREMMLAQTSGRGKAVSFYRKGMLLCGQSEYSNSKLYLALILYLEPIVVSPYKYQNIFTISQSHR